MVGVAEAQVKKPMLPLLKQIIGPGLITGASDDDPSGIATYSQAGAQFGYGLAWTLIVTYPLMSAIQEISGRIGRVTGRGLAGNLAICYPPWLVAGLIGLMAVANVANLGADLGAMGSALQLLVKGPAWLYVIGFALLSAGLEIFVRYSRYASVLKWLTASLLAYVGALFFAGIPWSTVLYQITHPALTFDTQYLMMVVAVLGTTISPYLFFWQAELEVEEQEEITEARPLAEAPEQAPEELRRIRLDTYVGMALSNIIALCIMITTAATLNAHGVKDIQSASQAAEALKPIAGNFAFALFALGIIGTGLLALPVFAGSVGYAIGELRGWPIGLAQKPARAKRFYGVIAIATVVGAAMNFVGIDPIKALVWSAVLNGIAAGPIMIMMMLLVMRRDIMGEFQISWWLNFLGWLAALIMIVTAAALIISFMV